MKLTKTLLFNSFQKLRSKTINTNNATPTLNNKSLHLSIHWNLNIKFKNAIHPFNFLEIDREEAKEVPFNFLNPKARKSTKKMSSIIPNSKRVRSLKAYNLKKTKTNKNKQLYNCWIFVKIALEKDLLMKNSKTCRWRFKISSTWKPTNH